MEENSKKIKIAWLHNYDTQKNPSSGIFMYQLFYALDGADSSFQIELFNIGSVNNPLTMIVKYFKYRNILKRFDILHAQYGSGTGFFISLFSINKIVSLRGSDWYNTPSKNILEIIHTSLGCLLTRLSIHRFDKIIVMSERMQEEVNKQYPKLDVEVIPDGIDLEKFQPNKSKKDSSYRILFSSVQKNNTGKRFELAQSAFNIFNAKYPNSELVFMSGIAHDKVSDFINGVDVILLTSTHEGWPNIIKEGLACNIPFVSTDVSDLKYFANLTKTCKVCDDNAESLAKGLDAVYNNKINENLRKFIEYMDIAKINSKLIDLYSKLAS